MKTVYETVIIGGFGIYAALASESEYFLLKKDRPTIARENQGSRYLARLTPAAGIQDLPEYWMIVT